MGQLEGLKKDVEIVQAIMEVIISKIENLDYKVENSDVNVENAFVSMLKEIFGLDDNGEQYMVIGEGGAPPLVFLDQQELDQERG